MTSIAKIDQRYVWHPFTQMADWLKQEPIVITEGEGAIVWDSRGRKYLDANSSIWTNLHGHNHPGINVAIRMQLNRIAHSSALGLANEPASRLAERLIKAANAPGFAPKKQELSKVFFSDDGSTAMEVAVKLSTEFTRRTRPEFRPRFLSLQNAYHGDTIGAMAIGQIDLFHKAYSNLLFKTDRVMAPYCYRCPFNRAKPERADAREYRKCNWECIGKLEQKHEAAARAGKPYSAFVFEPLIQGAAGMIPQPAGWLKRAAKIAHGFGTQLIADEVMTGFGRTGCPEINSRSQGAKSATAQSLFASHQEKVQPDFMALAKGLSGGYLPIAATLTTQPVFDAFLGRYDEFKTFFHGHSFTSNQLGAAAALANLNLLDTAKSKLSRSALQSALRTQLQGLWSSPAVGDIRQVGLIAGIELVRNWRTRESFDLREQIGAKVCEVMASNGVLTRPIGSVIVLMPPYCTTENQLQSMITVLSRAIKSVTRSYKM